jgi:hypothetical protein
MAGMASAPPPASSPIDWSIQQISASGLSIPAARLQVTVYLGSPPAKRHSPRDLCWLDTGAPISVVPFHVHDQRLAWQPIPGIRTTWAGQPCALGRIDIWLATHQPPFVRGPFSLLAKFPQADPPGDLIPILLGLEFFLAHQAEFQVLLPPRQGILSLP